MPSNAKVRTAKSKKRRYSEKEKAAALVVLDFCEGNDQEAAKRLGIPRETLRDWASGRRDPGPEVADLRHMKKKELAELFEDVILAALEKKLEAPAGLTAMDIGILTDKMQILRGKPDSISKSISATPEQRRSRILELVTKAKGA